MEVVAQLVGQIWDCSFNATCLQFGYLYHYKDSVERLRNQAQKLAYARERVQAQIDEATRRGEIIVGDVMNWIGRVDSITAEAEKFLQGEDKANKRCLKGLCFDPWLRYRFGREAQKKIEALSSFLEEGKFEGVSRKAAPPGIITCSAMNYNFKSRESITKEIMKALNEENVSIVGICGMGGVGKTTLVKEISKQVVQKNIFDTVAMAVVSQTQSYVKIQGEIASMLGIVIPADEEESGRARFLWQKIKEKQKLKKPKLEPEQILIILDDVWKGIELERVGIPSGEDHRGCKIVVTSRSKKVCMAMNAKTFTVGTLPREESWELFRDVAGETVDNPDINPTAREVVDECDGLPIAIVTVAGALKNETDKCVWIDAAQQLKMSSPTNIEDVEEKVFRRLAWSYNYLANEELKSVFLLCCLFPEDFDIPIELLMRYGMGLRLFREVYTMEAARNRTHTLVSTLASSFLLITDNDNKHVKMHDVIRDVAIKLSKDKHNILVKAGIGLQKWPSVDTIENLTRISLMHNYIHEVPEGFKHPELQALLLQGNSRLVVPNNFFEGMKSLKVLDMSRVRIFALNPSLQLLANLTTLCLNNRRFGEVDISLIGKLTSLEILSLQNSDISEIPREFEQLINLRLFDLTDCSNLEEIPPGVILGLKKLEELYVSSYRRNNLAYESRCRLFIELQALGRHILLRVNTKEAGLTILLSSTILSNYMPLEKHTSFFIAIGNQALNPLGKYTSWSRILFISGISFRQIGWVNELLKTTEVLQLCEMVGSKNILPHLLNPSCNHLKFLALIDCREITYLLNALERNIRKAFNTLEYLSMERIPNLIEICHGPLPTESLRKVKDLQISFCDNLLNIVPSHLLQRLQSLEKLEACNCASVEYAFDFERLVTANREPKFLSSLKYLRLCVLPEMTQIWNGDATLISLSNLVSIWISDCHRLKHIFSPSIVKGLMKLKTLFVSGCITMEEIVSDKKAEIGATTERITFPCLRIIELRDLDNLTRFYGGQGTIEFPALQSVDIQGCPKMRDLR